MLSMFPRRLSQVASSPFRGQSNKMGYPVGRIHKLKLGIISSLIGISGASFIWRSLNQPNEERRSLITRVTDKIQTAVIVEKAADKKEAELTIMSNNITADTVLSLSRGQGIVRLLDPDAASGSAVVINNDGILITPAPVLMDHKTVKVIKTRRSYVNKLACLLYSC